MSEEDFTLKEMIEDLSPKFDNAIVRFCCKQCGDCSTYQGASGTDIEVIITVNGDSHENNYRSNRSL